MPFFTSRAPDANVLFYPYSTEKTNIGGLQKDVARLLRQKSANTGGSGAIEARADILDLSTSKSKGGVGTFSMLLGSGKNYLSLIHPGCWCLIYISDEQIPSIEDVGQKMNDSDDHGFKMLGVVRSVRRKEVTSPNGEKTVRFVVTGEDFQSVFNTEIYLNAHLARPINNASAKEKFTGFPLTDFGVMEIALSPDRLVGTIMELFLGNPYASGSISGRRFVSTPSAGGRISQAGQPLITPIEFRNQVMGAFARQKKNPKSEDRLFMGMVMRMFQDLDGKKAFNVLEPMMVSPWSLMMSYSNSVVNELYTDLLPVNVEGIGTRFLPSIVFRTRPYGTKRPPGISKSRFLIASDAVGIQKTLSGVKQKKTFVSRNSLDHFYVSRYVSEDEILALDTGKSDHERRNLFFVTQDLGLSPTAGELQAIAQIAGNNLINVADATSINRYGVRPHTGRSIYNFPGGDPLKFNKMAIAQWQDAHLFENGSAVIAGSKSHIPVGTLVQFIERGWIGHIERVDHHYSVQPAGQKLFRSNIFFVRLMTTAFKPINAVEISNKENQIGDFDRGVVATEV